jgi:hypothetical protein
MTHHKSTFLILAGALCCALWRISAADNLYKEDYQTWGKLERGGSKGDLLCSFTILTESPVTAVTEIEKNAYIPDKQARVCEFSLCRGNKYTIMWLRNSFSSRNGWKYSVFENLPFDAEQLLTENPRAAELHENDRLKTLCSMNFSEKKLSNERNATRWAKVSIVNINESKNSLFYPPPVSFEGDMWHVQGGQTPRFLKTFSQFCIEARVDAKMKTALLRIMIVYNNGNKSDLEFYNPQTMYTYLMQDIRNYCFETKVNENSRYFIVWSDTSLNKNEIIYKVNKDIPFDLFKVLGSANGIPSDYQSHIRAFCSLTVDRITSESIRLTCEFAKADKNSQDVTCQNLSWQGDFLVNTAYIAASDSTTDIRRK